MDYTIAFANGTITTTTSYRAARAAVRSRFPRAVVGHDGDLQHGGDRTLCWSSRRDACDDDGLRAVATIRLLGTE